MSRLITFILILDFVSYTLSLSHNVQNNMSVFNVMDFGACGDGKCDDSKAILSAWEHACGAEEQATLVIPPNKIFLVTKLKLNGPCKPPRVLIKFAGKIVAPTMNAWKGDKSNWIEISYVNSLTIEASGEINIDGYGSTWWNKCKSCDRPTALRFHACNNLGVNYLNMINSPGAHIAVNGCNGATFTHMNINAPPHSPNTDGFDISISKNIVIQDSNIGTGDDCIAINGGSSNIYVTRVTCGPGHGISIGSLGKYNSHEIVEDVRVRNCSFIGATNGARIKTWQGGSGYARNITFEQIQLIETENPIIIDQSYGSKTSNPMGNTVHVSNVTYIEFEGTSLGDKAIDLKCSTLGCFNITLDQIRIVSLQPNKLTYASCKNAHGRVGFSVPRVFCLSK